jgi:hypothetical protein
MKSSIFIFIIAIMAATFNSCQTSQQINNYDVEPDDPSTFRFFSILACVDDDSTFINVQKEMNIDPILSYYILFVNISDKNPDKHYISFGTGKYAIRAPFSSLNKKTQEKLISWGAPNKSNLLDVWRYDKLKSFDR